MRMPLTSLLIEGVVKYCFVGVVCMLIVVVCGLHVITVVCGRKVVRVPYSFFILYLSGVRSKSDFSAQPALTFSLRMYFS